MLAPGTRLHFIGIGGIGVSAVARVAVERGFRVSGSDVRRSQLTDAMAAIGAHVTIGHRPENVDDIDIVVVSTAIPEHNVELVTARQRGLATMHRSELLAALVEGRHAIGVTGTHGKGTTAAMITWLLEAGGFEPGFIIGGLLNNYHLNARDGQRVVVAEVDESDGSHRNVPVDALVVNYLEADHLNYYRDRDDIISSMIDAVEKTERIQRAFVNIDCDGNRQLIERVSKPCVTYGVESPANYHATLDPRRGLPTRFEVHAFGESLGLFELNLPGRYNVTNAVGAIAVAHTMGVEVEQLRAATASFSGLENRFTVADAGHGVQIVKDYNSHPTAIRKVLDSAADLTRGRIFSVFKPYRYTLTSYLKDEYATAFDGSAQVVITTMYAANEDPIEGIDTNFVVSLLQNRGLDVAHVPDQNDITAHLEALVRDGDTVIFFGGDDFFRMADAWAERRKRGHATTDAS